MQTRKYCRALALVAIFGVCPAAMAQSSGFYLLGSLGYTDHSADLGEFNRTYALGAPPDISSLSESETAYKLGAGYRFHQNFAVEAAWGRLGKLTYNVARPGAFGGTFQSTIEPEVLQLSLIGILPLSKEFDVFGRIGVASIDNKGGVSQSGGFGPFGPCGVGIVCQAGSTSNDTVGVFGLGLNYNMGGNLFLRAEFEYYSSYKVSSVPNLQGVLGPFAQPGGDIKIDSTVWSIGVGYRF